MKQHFLFKGLCIAVLFLTLLRIADENGTFLPGWAEWNTYTREIDLPEHPQAVMTLKQAHLTIYDQHLLYESQPGWKIQDAVIQDIDHDDNLELVMLVYRKGNYGEHLPFWKTKNDMSWSQHFFVFRWKGERFQSVWMSSAIGMKAKSFQLEDGLLSIQEPDGKTSDWKWETWGFVLQEDTP